VKSLSQMLSTLKELETLDVSGNNISEEGLEHLKSALERSRNLAEIRQLRISFNPIQSGSLNYLSSLVRSKNIVSLSLVSCDLTSVGAMDQLDRVKHIDISYNHLTVEGFRTFLAKLNLDAIETLNLERCSQENDLGEHLSSKIFTSLKEINLAGLNFDENAILDILRGLEKCERLKLLDLSHQKQLTFLSLKYILVNMDSACLEHVKLLGCPQLHNIASLGNVEGACQKSLQKVEVSLPKDTPDAFNMREKFIERMKEVWEAATESQGKVESDGSVLRLTRGDEKEEANPFH
jgi:Ran GTPase-activating protein (RanGAP) involved in mRNA processing and transport